MSDAAEGTERAAVIRVERLTKRYGERVAVDDLSFAVAGGEVLGLVGPNGAGKTTTLRALAGIHAPTTGRAEIAGHDVVREPVAAKRRLALVPDDPALFVSLTVWEHLELTGRLYGLERWEERGLALLEELELADRRGSLADELSRGMRQKVAVACALLHEPAALFLDEPLTGLDPRGIRTLFSLLRRRAEAGAAVVLSTHLLGEVGGLCSSLLVMRRGRLLFHGPRDEMLGLFPDLGPAATLEEVFFRLTEGEAEPREAGPA